MSPYLCALRDEAKALNDIALTGLPESGKIKIFEAENSENDEPLMNTSGSRISRRGTNFPNDVACKIGAKVMFLTNSMLSSKGIANRSLVVITALFGNGDIEAAFPTQDGIEVHS
jgi:hypothetical protein